MLDMVDYKSEAYARAKGEERVAEMEILKRAAELGAPLGVVKEYAKRLATLKARDSEYFQAMIAAQSKYTKLVIRIRKTRALEVSPKDVPGVGRYFSSVFHSREGRQMLDKWDAEDAAMKETANA